jgi:subtilisin family serine protease
VAAIAGASPQYVYTTAVNGFAAQLNAGQLNALRNNPAVEYVEENGVVQASVTQTGATWGIDRIDQRDRPLSTTFTYLNTGVGVRAYIVDTGIRLTHTQLAGRAVTGYDAVTAGGTASDCNGHGTHVAGTVGGTTHGVAKGVSLVAVRVLNCQGSGTNAGVIAGVDWVANNAVQPAVANMSLGGGANTTLDNAVKNAVARGITFVVAAGNGNFFGIAQNACNYSPARVPEAITVGATTSTDAKASYSNYGSCLDIFAPGSSITSSWYTNDTATNTISGTSMASPHVAGVAALYLQSNPTATPAQVVSALTTNASVGKVTSPGSGSPNRLLFTAY